MGILRDLHFFLDLSIDSRCIVRLEGEQRLERICKYRKAGIQLNKIGETFDYPDISFATVLKERFEDLDHEICHLHEQ